MGGTYILDESLTVEVMPRKAGQTFNSFSMPAGVAITNNGKLIVAEWGKDSITISSFGKRGSEECCLVFHKEDWSSNSLFSLGKSM